MPLLGVGLAVAIPDTVLEEKESLRERTAKLGVIARACAIYGVDLIQVFRDPRGHGEAGEIMKVLRYLETPQYLRKRIYPLDEALKFAGILPPLRIPSHKAKVPFGQVTPGEVREGVVNGDGTVDIGLDVAPNLKGNAKPGSRVTTKVVSLNPPVAESISREKVGRYWGYEVESRSVEEVFSDGRYRVKIATSRMGTPLGQAMPGLEATLGKSKSAKLVFGSPSRGLFDIVGRELDAKADFVVNLFPSQQVETVRSEEAISAGLAIVSALIAKKA